jgi:hypothetical protein
MRYRYPRVLSFFALAALAAAVAGCEEEASDSTDVSTLDLSVSVDAVDEGKGATVFVRIGSPIGPLRLTGGDTLKLRMAGAPLVVREIEEDGSLMYAADVESLSDDILMDIVRPSDRSIEGFVISVPPPILLSAEPVAGDAPLVITWSGAPEPTHTLGLSIVGTCIDGIHRNLPNDVGTYTVFQTELRPAGPSAATACPLTVSLSRYTTIGSDLLPEGGFFYEWIRVARSVEVAWVE